MPDHSPILMSLFGFDVDWSSDKVVAAVSLAAAVIPVLALVLPVGRKRVAYRVTLDSPVDVTPDQAEGERFGLGVKVIRDGDELDNPGLVLIRVKNVGRRVVSWRDWEVPPYFSFGGRTVIAAEVTTARNESLIRRLRPALATREPTGVGDTEPRHAEPSAGRHLAPAPPEDPGPRDQGPPTYVTTQPVGLNRREYYRMLVLVAGAGSGVRVHGHLEDGSIVKDHVNRRPGARVATLTGAALALIGLAAGVLLFPRHPGSTPRAAYCREGRLFGQGSSAFKDLMKTLGEEYERECPGASVDYHETSSALGTISLAGIDPAQAPNQLAMSDGLAAKTADPSTLKERRVAVVIFAVVVSKDVGARVKTLTPDQLKHIFVGDYTNWNKIVRDFNQPIHVVSRSSTSGSRRTFEEHILHGTEQQLNSDDCVNRRPGAGGGVTQCEEGDTDSLLSRVEQIKGAIGYAELAAASRKLYVTTVEINGTAPNAANVLGNLYDFWTVEHAYTYGPPEPGSLVAGFLDFLSSQPATAVLESDQHLACTAREVSGLCREER